MCHGGSGRRREGGRGCPPSLDKRFFLDLTVACCGCAAAATIDMTLVFQQHYIKTDDCTGDLHQAAFHGCELVHGSRAGSGLMFPRSAAFQHRTAPHQLPSAPVKANVARFNPHSIADSCHIFRCEEAAMETTRFVSFYAQRRRARPTLARSSRFAPSSMRTTSAALAPSTMENVLAT